MNVNRMGLDLAKNVFELYDVDESYVESTTGAVTTGFGE